MAGSSSGRTVGKNSNRDEQMDKRACASLDRGTAGGKGPGRGGRGPGRGGRGHRETEKERDRQNKER